MTKLEGRHRGAKDYQDGRHGNPYSYITDERLYKEWYKGYEKAKAQFEADEDRKESIRQEELSKFDPSKIK